MKSITTTLEQETGKHVLDMRGRSRLHVRMTISYVLVSFSALLLLEILFGLVVPTLVLYGSLADDHRLWQVKQAAQLYTLAATVQTEGEKLDPHMTFQPGQPSSLRLPGDELPGDSGISYINTRLPENTVAFVLLIAPDGRVLASSYPARYPIAAPVANLLPSQSHLVARALTGVSGSTIAMTPRGSIPVAAMTIWSREKRALGAIYLQYAPIGTDLYLQFTQGLLALGLIWLVVAVPIGALFGILTTRRLVQRIRTLATATVRFAQGDYAQRVIVACKDEIGQLEQQFNWMAEQLVESTAKRQELTEQNARMAERARISRELHDAIAQDLFSLRMLTGGLQTALPADSPLQPQVALLKQTSTTMIREMRALLLELRPTRLADQGLAEALEDLAAAYRTRLGIAVTTAIQPGIFLSAPIEHALLRITQEALSNAARHADATTITLDLSLQGETITFTLADNGSGFTPGEDTAEHGLGLRLMQERVQELQGTFEVQTAPSQGTRIHITFPWRKEDDSYCDR